MTNWYELRSCSFKLQHKYIRLQPGKQHVYKCVTIFPLMAEMGACQKLFYICKNPCDALVTDSERTRRRRFYTVAAIGGARVWVSKTLRAWWMWTDREKVDLFSDTCVWTCVCEDHMSRLQGLSVHISLNDKPLLQAKVKIRVVRMSPNTLSSLSAQPPFLCLSSLLTTPTTLLGMTLRVPDSHINNL